MSIDSVRNLATNSVRRSGTQLDVYCSSNAPLLRTEPGGAAFGAINISLPNGVKTKALCTCTCACYTRRPPE
jgi:hypothetical protein